MRHCFQVYAHYHMKLVLRKSAASHSCRFLHSKRDAYSRRQLYCRFACKLQDFAARQVRDGALACSTRLKRDQKGTENCVVK